MPTAAQDWAVRSTAPNIVRVFHFNEVAQLGVLHTWPSDFGYDNNAYPAGDLPTIDVTPGVPASGLGCLKFTINPFTGAGGAGHWYANFSADRSVLFGEGQDFYIQWRQKFNDDFCTRVYQSLSYTKGWKQCIINAGDFGTPVHPTSSNDGCGAEVVFQNTNCRRIVAGYTSSNFDGWEVAYGGGGGPILQNAMPSPYCLYGDVVLNGDRSHCFAYWPNEWMTFQVHIRVGHWNTADGILEVWAARANQPSQLVFSYTNMNFKNSEGTTHKYGKIHLLPYHTDKSPAENHPVGYTWYDELIISRTRVADPAPLTITPLGQAAANLGVRQWAVFQTNNATVISDAYWAARVPADPNPSPGYEDSGNWDPVARNFLWMSSAHAPTAWVFQYEDDSNNWIVNTVTGYAQLVYGHTYCSVGINPVEQVLYYHQYSGVDNFYRYPLAATGYLGSPQKLWALCKERSAVSGTGNIDPTVAYFPELDLNDGYGRGRSVVIVGMEDGDDGQSPRTYHDYAGILTFKDLGGDTGVWTKLNTPGAHQYRMGSYNIVCKYSVVKQCVLFGGGCGYTECYKLSANGTITPMQPFPRPVHLSGDFGAHVNLCADPVTGNFLLFASMKNSYQELWELDPTLASNPWVLIDGHLETTGKIGSTPFQAGAGFFGTVSAPISHYGVIMFLQFHYGPAGPTVWLYKHTASDAIPIPAPTGAIKLGLR